MTVLTSSSSRIKEKHTKTQFNSPPAHQLFGVGVKSLIIMFAGTKRKNIMTTSTVLKLNRKIPVTKMYIANFKMK